MFRSAVIFQSVIILLLAPAVLHAEFGDYRSIFVDRYDYPYTNGNIASMTNEINAMMEDAADQGFTEVIWQVRGRADALYHSNFEPDVNGLTPGFDPLQTALTAAHSRGLKLHAWLNSTPMWNTTAINPPASHIYHNTNPSFRLEDINGNLEPQDGWSNYSSVNPILPEVHTHINNVVNDIATNYAVDGIHLDYIRYIPGGSNFDRFPHDSVSHQMFNQATGLDGSNPANFTAYKDYIKGRITDLVASIKTTVDTAEISTGRTMEYSASVWRDPDVGENSYMQDYRTWLENDYLDVVMPMIYLSASNDHLYFNDNLLNTLSISTNSRVAPTLASYLHVAGGGGGVDLTLSQIERAYLMGADGINFYDHPNFFNGYTAGERQALKDYLDFIADPPAGSPGSVIDDFETDQGHFDWLLTYSGSNQGILAGSTAERVTDEAESGNAAQKLVIDGEPDGWFLRHLSGIGTAAAPSGNVALDATGYIGFWLKTADSGLSVQLAMDDPGTADRGFVQNIIADNQWHLYQWNLEDDYQWEGWVTGDGNITGPTVTIDSIQFSGAGDATIYMDTVSYNPDQLLAAAAPCDFNADGFVDEDDLSIWRAGFSTTSGAGAAVGDADGDTDVDGSDFLAWQRDLTGAASSTALAEAVPEPATWLLALLGTLLGQSFRRPIPPTIWRTTGGDPANEK